MHLAGAVGGQDHDRRLRRLDRAKLWHGDLKIAERLEQERLERFVGAVQLVDQQHRRAVFVRAHRLQQRTFDQKVRAEKLAVQTLAIRIARGLGCPDGNHLCRKIPFIHCARRIEPFVALQPDQPPV